MATLCSLATISMGGQFSENSPVVRTSRKELRDQTSGRRPVGIDVACRGYSGRKCTPRARKNWAEFMGEVVSAPPP